MNNALFEIFIYTCTQEQFVDRVRSDVESWFTDHVSKTNVSIWQQGRDEEIQRHMKSVRYNELVGCIEIYAQGSQLRAGYWFSEKKKIIVGSRERPVIKWRGKLLEKHYRHTRLSSPAIFHDFRNSVAHAASQRKRLEPRFIDFAAFDRCGPFIDWRQVLQLR